MRAGLLASTVTPGRTAPDASRTVPAIDCADASAGTIVTTTAASHNRVTAAATLNTRMPILHTSTSVRLAFPAVGVGANDTTENRSFRGSFRARGKGHRGPE